MKKLHILALAITAVLASSFAVAQTATPATGVKAAPRIDANGDGVIDRAEAAKMPRLAEKFDQLDIDKDGKLSASERQRTPAADARAARRRQAWRSHAGAGHRQGRPHQPR